MIKVIAKEKGQGVKCRVKVNCRGKRAVAREAAGVITTICEIVLRNVPELTPEELMGAVMGKLKGGKPEGNESETGARRTKDRSGGLTVKCYGSPEECAECDPTGWCSRFNGMCEDFCVGEMVADGEEEE